MKHERHSTITTVIIITKAVFFTLKLNNFDVKTQILTYQNLSKRQNVDL